MSPEPTACPYCNALVPVPAGAAGGQFLPCPRCGERFAYRGPENEGNHDRHAVQTGPTAQTRQPSAQVVSDPLLDRVGERLRGWSRRRVAVTVLSVMIVMAAAGLTLALLTKDFRRRNDRPRGTEDVAPAVQVTAPADLAGLGYLPPDTDIIAGVHVAEAEEEPTGRLFLERFRPAEAVAEGADAAAIPADGLERWTGLRLQEVDHVVLGLNATSRVVPRLVLVVETRQSYDPEKVRTALRASRRPEPGRPLYRFRLERPPLDAVLWFAGERTLIVGLSPEDLQAVPEKPRAGIDHLSAPLQTILRERLGHVAPFWVVGHADDWNKTGAKLLLASRPKDARRALESVRTFGVWLQFGQGVTLNGSFGSADEAAARSLETYLAPAKGEHRPLALLGSRPATEPLARELGQSLRVVRADDWVSLQAKADAEAVRQALAGGGPAK
ncbi:MAG TPA: hypothetical protein VJ739_09625 [Gemmataceae bacterium]|nr:hypothetical protein [Gemmataceae bacterium]